MQGESPEKKLYCSTDIEDIMKSGGDVEFVAGFGVAQKGYSDIGLKAVDIKMILSDALYDDTKFNWQSVLENLLDSYLKENFENYWKMTQYKRLLCIYDCLVNK